MNFLCQFLSRFFFGLNVGLLTGTDGILIQRSLNSKVNQFFQLGTNLFHILLKALNLGIQPMDIFGIRQGLADMLLKTCNVSNILKYHLEHIFLNLREWYGSKVAAGFRPAPSMHVVGVFAVLNLACKGFPAVQASDEPR